MSCWSSKSPWLSATCRRRCCRCCVFSFRAFGSSEAYLRWTPGLWARSSLRLVLVGLHAATQNAHTANRLNAHHADASLQVMSNRAGRWLPSSWPHFPFHASCQASTGKAIFQSDSEIDHLFKVFRVVGTPDLLSWPEVVTFKNFSPKFPVYQRFDLAQVTRACLNSEEDQRALHL